MEWMILFLHRGLMKKLGKKRIAVFIAVFLLILFSVFSVYKFIGIHRPQFLIGDNQSEEKSRLKIGLITGFGGLGDKGFNDLQYNGMIRAKKKYGFDFFYYPPRDLQDIEEKVVEYLDIGVDVIIMGEGIVGGQVIEEYAPSYPETIFILLDNTLPVLYPNTAAIIFKQNEGSFLAGYLSGKISKTNSIGFVGGEESDVILDFWTGFYQGAKFVNPKCGIYCKFISELVKNPAKVWNSPIEAGIIAYDLINKNKTDIIYAVASGSNFGIFNVCRENSMFAIGVDSDQDYIIPGTILTSVLKNIDQAIVFIIEKIVNNCFKSEIYSLGLKENGVGLSEMKFTREMIDGNILKELEKIKEKIIQGEIKIDSYYD